MNPLKGRPAEDWPEIIMDLLTDANRERDLSDSAIIAIANRIQALAKVEAGLIPDWRDE